MPAPLTRLIGRERELATVGALLARPEVRLVTLTGPGGVGKTRLALALAAQAASRFADGVVLVPLAPVRDPSLVLPTVARVLDLRDAADQSLPERLQNYLATRELLLVLDNVEQVLEAAPDIADLLTACPALTVLATSRSPLRISGERNAYIAPLPLPDPPHATARTTSVAELLQNDAVRLFVERAQEVHPDFTLTETNTETVAAICRRLDGLPLAIELAAARVKLFPGASLLTRLEQRLPLLTGGPRNAPRRQQTMRDAIAWSYDLLDPETQALFRRLSVFVGGFTLDAAAAVARGEDGANGGGDVGDDELTLLNGVSALAEASLLAATDTAGDEPRYVMLETVREFGLEMLASSGETPPSSGGGHGGVKGPPSGRGGHGGGAGPPLQWRLRRPEGTRRPGGARAWGGGACCSPAPRGLLPTLGGAGARRRLAWLVPLLAR